MYLHTALAAELIRQREQELARSAGRCGPLPVRRRRERRSLRYRAGWKLIEIGLTLARTPEDAGSSPLAHAPISIKS
jgi:hypothetical protein